MSSDESTGKTYQTIATMTKYNSVLQKMYRKIDEIFVWNIDGRHTHAKQFVFRFPNTDKWLYFPVVDETGQPNYDQIATHIAYWVKVKVPLIVPVKSYICEKRKLFYHLLNKIDG